MSRNLSAHFEVEGWVKLVIHTVDESGAIVDSRDATDWFPNLITDQGLDRMGTATFKGACQVGTGSTAPAFTDTSLTTFLAGVGSFVSESSSYTAGPPPYVTQTTMYRFGTGVAAGNLTEVGFGWGSSGATLYSHALIVDGSGNPTSITVLPTEILEVYYQHRMYPPTSDVTGVINISGVNYNYTLRAATISTRMSTGSNGPGWGAYGSGPAAGFNTYSINSPVNSSVYAGALGAITGFPAGSSQSGATTVNTIPYVPGSLSLTATMVISISNGNIVGGFRCMTISTRWSVFQVEFVPNVPKTNAFQFSITATMTWNRRSI